MNGSRSPARKAANRRTRKIQKTFQAILPPQAGDEPPAFPTLDFHSFPYRTALANWPDEWRERWGHRANALEATGLPWKDAEARAFFEVKDERREEVGIATIPLAGPIERN